MRDCAIVCPSSNHGTHEEIRFCLWCGGKFQNLEDKWFEILAQEYNIKDPLHNDADKIRE